MAQIEYRAAAPEDLNFIIATWLKGARNGERHSFMQNKDYFTYYRQYIIRRLSDSFVRVAYDHDEPEIIVAYAVYTIGAANELILHWVYVRRALWGMKIAKNLIANIFPEFKTRPITSTTLCIFQCGYDRSNGDHVSGLSDRYPNLTYNPYVLE